MAYDEFRDRANVVVSQDQLPLAIGKAGQNVRLRFIIDDGEIFSFSFSSDAVTTASGIPVSWLEEYDLPTDGSMDHEKIGASPFTVYEEWIAGTNPNDITDILRMTESPEESADGFIIRWQSVAVRTYMIDRSRDLTGEPQFETVAAGIQGIDGVSEYVDKTADSPGPFFYRVVVEKE